MTKYTPGPWKIMDRAPGEMFITTSGRGYGEEVFIARLYSQFECAARDANANLLAAAPDLLEAAKRAKLILEGSTNAIHKAVLNQLTEAIAKAEGK